MGKIFPDIDTLKAVVLYIATHNTGYQWSLGG